MRQIDEMIQLGQRPAADDSERALDRAMDRMQQGAQLGRNDDRARSRREIDQRPVEVDEVAPAQPRRRRRTEVE